MPNDDRTSLYRKMHVAIEIELDLPEPTKYDNNVDATLAALADQPQAVMDAILTRHVVKNLKRMNTDDLCRVAGCVDSDQGERELIDRVLKADGVMDEDQRDMDTRDMTAYLDMEMGAQANRLIRLQAPEDPAAGRARSPHPEPSADVQVPKAVSAYN